MHKAFKPVRQRILRDSYLLVNLTDLRIVVLSLISVQQLKGDWRALGKCDSNVLLWCADAVERSNRRRSFGPR